MICIPKEYADSFKAAIKNGSLDVDKLAQMGSIERKQFVVKAFTDAQMSKREIVTGKEAQLISKFEKTEIDELASKFNKGFEQRIVSISKQGKKQNRLSELRDAIARGDLDGNELELVEKEAKELDDKIATHQQKVLNGYLQRELNKVPTTRRKNIVESIKSVKHMMTPEETKLKLQEIIEHKLGVGLTEETTTTLAKLADEAKIAREVMDTYADKTFKIADESFEKTPAFKESSARISKLSGKEKDSAVFNLEADRTLFKNNVLNGLVRLDGTKTTASEYKTINKPQLEQSLKQQRLLDYYADLEKGLDSLTLDDLKSAEGKYAKFQQGLNLAGRGAVEVFSLTKSLVGALDFSAIFIQNFKYILLHPQQGFKNLMRTFAESFDVMLNSKAVNSKFFSELDNLRTSALRAELNMRANARNGMYDALGSNSGLSVGREEALPSSWPERLPIVGRLYKGTDYFFSALAKRNRASLADSTIDQLTRIGVDILNDKKTAEELGIFVGAMTGRGLPFGMKNISPETSDLLNKTFFSPRFVGSLWYTPQSLLRYIKHGDEPMAKIAAKENASVILRAALLLGTINFVNQQLGGEGVDFKPDSKTFGHVKIGDNAFDITGGHSSLVSLVGKMFAIRNYGKEWDSKLEIYKDVPWGKSASDAFADYFAYKASPGASVVRDFVNGYAFGGEELSASDMAFNLMVPLSIQTYMENDSAGFGEGLAILLANGVGINSKELSVSPLSEDWKVLKKANPKAYETGKKEFNTMLFSEVEKIRSSASFDKMTKEEQYDYIKKVSDRLKKNTIDKYLSENDIDPDALPE